MKPQGLAGFEVLIRPMLWLAGFSDVDRAYDDAGGEFRFDELLVDMDWRMDVESSQFYPGYTPDSFQAGKNMPDFRITKESIVMMDVEGMTVDTDNAPPA